METYTLNEFAEGLRQLGVIQGEVLIVWGDFFHIGKCRGVQSKRQVLEGFLAAFQEVVGPEGTLVVPTWNTDIAETGEPFIWEETPSKAGVFSEYVRQHPESIRSLHPLISYTAIGQQASYICDLVAKNAYGLETPFDRLLKLNTRAISIGLRANQTCSIVHQAEMMMGVPYRYQKEFTNPVFCNGQQVHSEYYLYVRDLDADIVKDGNEKLFQMFEEKGFELRSVQIGGGNIESYMFTELFEACVVLLQNDIYGLLKHPPEVRTYRK